MKRSWMFIAALLLPISALAADKVVVVPLGGATGNANPDDVLKGKTFSSAAAGKGAVGTLEPNAESIGDATPADVLAGKVFSNSSNIGLTGTLEIPDNSTIYTNSIGMKFSLIPAGSFAMGSPAGTGDETHYPIWPEETGRYSNEKQHVVTLTESFYMQTTEVTQGQWVQVMETNPSFFISCGPNCPVEGISWDDAQSFIDALNTREERENCNISPNNCYSLPTEAQWEYAARGGTVTAFYNGEITSGDFTSDSILDQIGWYCNNSEVSYSGCWDASFLGCSTCSGTNQVGQKLPNSWGLYDMSGSVWEWCADRYGDYPDGPVEDPFGPTSGSERVLRGGSWLDYARYARSASRDGYEQDEVHPVGGFRLVLHLNN